MSFTDRSGNLWLFGGYGYSSPTEKDLNDLWKYSGGQWTWVGGSNQTEQPGIYGTKGIASPGNIPGARYEAVSWTDPQGNLWLFGGLGIDSVGTRSDLNDLWKYSNGQWTWMEGSAIGQSGLTYSQRAGVYGTQGVPNPANSPGARVDSNSWTDAAGNLWLFGGSGYDSTGQGGILNDLWRYYNGQWTWMAGSNLANQDGIYGTQGTPAPGNSPGARSSAAAWTDSAGNLWLFSGEGLSSSGIDCPGSPCTLNDLWRYSANGGWAWMGGTNQYNQVGIYGTEGAGSPSNIPGGRTFASTWVDSEGNFWLFGGFGMDSTTGAYTVFGDLNDLWKYNNGQWTWINGSNKAPSQPNGVYGTQGSPASGNMPPARDSSVSWIDASGNLWLFGGDNSLLVGGGKLNDLWEYQP